MKLGKSILAAAILGVALAASASATPLKWTLHNVLFNDGGTASGSFVYDADTNVLSSVDITTTPGSSFPGAHYILPDISGAAFFAANPAFVTSNAADLTGTPLLALPIVASLTDAGGIDWLFVGDPVEGTCGVADCYFGAAARAVADGFISTSAVPEPATISLLMAGVAGAFIRRRRRAAAVN